MDIKVLENIMQEYGLVIRAIPNKIKRIYDSYHIKDFPDGKLEYVEKFGREMCVVMEAPNHAGKFVIDCAPHTYTDVKFTNGMYFNTIEDAVNYIIGGRKNGRC